MVQLVNRVKLYTIKPRIELTQVGRNARNNNLPLDDNDFKIYKGVTSEVEFSIRNNDRKPVDLSNARRVFVTIINPDSGENMLQQDVEVLEEKRGLVVLNIKPETIVNWDPGFYRYSVIIENQDGSQNILFMDKNQLSTGTLELIGNILPPIIQSVELDPQKFAPEGFTFPFPKNTPNQFISSAIAGSSELNIRNGLHTFTVKGENFSGKFLVEGSLEEQPSSNTTEPNTDWFPIELEAGSKEITFDQFTGIEVYNFFSNVNWIRFTYIPDRMNQGKLTKIQLVPGGKIDSNEGQF